MKLACTPVFVCFNRSPSLHSDDDFSPFKNSTTEARLLRNDIKFCVYNLDVLNRPNLQTFKHDLLHIVTGKSKQNITTIKPLSLESTPKDGVYPRAVRGALHSCKKRHGALWLTAMHSGKS